LHGSHLLLPGDFSLVFNVGRTDDLGVEVVVLPGEPRDGLAEGEELRLLFLGVRKGKRGVSAV
jgi:hypothetical protein